MACRAIGKPLESPRDASKPLPVLCPGKTMNPNWLGVISAAFAIAAFFVTHRITPSIPLKKRIPIALTATLSSIPAASFALYYTHLFPETAWYFQFRSIRATEFLLVLLGVAGGSVASLLPRMVRILPLAGVVASSVAPFLKPFIGPIPAGTLRDTWDGEVCLQSTPSTCGAASTATILKHLGHDATESELAAEAHSYNRGTEAWYLARAIRARGFDVDFEIAPGFHPEPGLPAVVGVGLGSIGHFIPILGQEGDHFIVGDPLHGREFLTLEELQQRYRFTGFHMRIRKP